MKKNLLKLGLAIIMKKFKNVGMATIVAVLLSTLLTSWYVLRPNPADCSTFFQCENGVPILMNCPEGLHFNPMLEVCDWPADAGCDENRIIVRGQDICPAGDSEGGGTTPTTTVKVYDNVYTERDKNSETQDAIMYAGISQNDPNKIGECLWYNKQPVGPKHKCYTITEP